MYRRVKFPETQLKVKCLAQKHNTYPRPELEPGRLDPESSVLTIAIVPLTKRTHIINPEKTSKKGTRI